MSLDEIIKSLEIESKYWEKKPNHFTQGRMFQANKTLEQLRLYQSELLTKNIKTK